MIPVQLEYAAPAGCPTQAEFVASVAGRGGDFAHPGPKTNVRTMVVKLDRDANGHSGSLQLRFDQTVSDPRQLRAESCAQVAEGLAVVAAIALRGAEDVSEPAVSEAAPTATPEATALPATQPAASEAPRETRLRTVGAWGNEKVPVTKGELEVSRSLVATLSGGLVLGAIPGVVLPRYDLSLSRANFITTPQGSNYLIGSVFGVRWSHLGPATHHSAGFSTDISGFKAGVTACASLIYDTSGFVALFCTGFAVGLVHLETKDASSDYEQSKDVGLGAATLELDARYNIGKYFHLGLTVGGDFWISKVTAERADGSELFQSNLFNANMQLGLGLHF